MKGRPYVDAFFAIWGRPSVIQPSVYGLNICVSYVPALKCCAIISRRLLRLKSRLFGKAVNTEIPRRLVRGLFCEEVL